MRISDWSSDVCSSDLGAAGGAMDIWLQVDQIDRRDALYRAAAADELEQGQPARIRLFFQCEPRCGPSPLEPGPRTPHRRLRQAPDDEGHRLWIGGRAALCALRPATVLIQLISGNR